METITIGKTGRKKGYINHTEGDITIRLDVDYSRDHYEVSGDWKLATDNRREAEYEFGKRLDRHDLDFKPGMLEKQLKQMEINDTICVNVNRELQKYEEQ